MWPAGSVVRPQPGRRQLDDVPFRVVEIEAVAAALPGHLAVDRHPAGGKAPPPVVQAALRDGEGHMQRPASVMTGYGAAGQVEILTRSDQQEEEQDRSEEHTYERQSLIRNLYR